MAFTSVDAAFLTAILGVVPAVAPSAIAGTLVPLDPKRTFIHTSSGDPSLPAIPLELAPLGVAPGDRIELRRLGDFDNGPGADIFSTTFAVFSASTTLLPPAELDRVVDAIDAGVDFVSAPTFFGSEPTDVPEDFVVSSGAYPGGVVCVIVPQGATHLFVAAHDSLYYDNSDPDGDYAVEIELLDPCAADIDGSGAVDGGDLGVLLAGWGVLDVIGGPGDLDCDGDVDGSDLGLLLAAWGPC